MRLSSSSSPEDEKKCLNSEQWHACAGHLVLLPPVGSRVVYFLQGHSEQVAGSTNKEVDAHIPNYPSLSPQLICHLHNVIIHVDVETDEIFAQMTDEVFAQSGRKHRCRNDDDTRRSEGTPPWATSSEFVIPLTKYVRAVSHMRISLGMRFRMLFEMVESSVRRYMGRVTGISDLDPSRCPNSHWHSVRVWSNATDHHFAGHFLSNCLSKGVSVHGAFSSR